MITEDWKVLVERTDGARTEANRMTRDRRKKLIGRDYTASVMVEMLAMSGSMSLTLYENLEIARKARNNRAHDMKVPTGNDIWACQAAIQECWVAGEFELTYSKASAVPAEHLGLLKLLTRTSRGR